MSKHPRFYRPELDVLRCLAFLLVFLHHAVQPSPGWLGAGFTAGAFGVCLFFFLSAYLITELLSRELQSTGTVHLGAFYMRRILRIWPLYFAALLLDFVHLHLTRPGTFTGARLAASLLLAGNLYVIHHSFIGSLSLPLWSISIEEQFYALWPSLQRRLRRNVLLAFCAVTFAVAYVALAREHAHGTDLVTGIWVNSFVQFQFFAAGAVTSLCLRGRALTLGTARRLTLFVLGLGMLYSAEAIFHVKSGLDSPAFGAIAAGYLLINAGCTTLFLAFLGASGLGRLKPLLYLGRISYGLYVFHFAMLSLCDRGLRILPQTPHPLALWLKGMIALLLTILAASISWHVLERPILRFKKRFEVIRTRTA